MFESSSAEFSQKLFKEHEKQCVQSRDRPLSSTDQNTEKGINTLSTNLKNNDLHFNY